MTRWIMAVATVGGVWYFAEYHEIKNAVIYLACISAVGFVGVDRNIAFLGDLIDKINERIDRT